MKVAIFSDHARVEKFLRDVQLPPNLELVYLGRECSDEDALRQVPDAHFILADAIKPVSATLIAGMPNLRLIHSEGVAFDKIDCAAAAARGIFVCNNKGANAGAVAEQAVLLMLGLLRSVLVGDAQVRLARQIQMKERLMVEGIAELGDCAVGLIGFGDIAKETALRLSAFGTSIFYYSRRQYAEALEQRYNVTYLPLDELLARCDIVSLHAPVTSETNKLVNDAFLSKMKDSALLINTARGELVDQEALVRALISGKLAGAGLDTLSPEPVQSDNPLLHLPDSVKDKVLFSPHIGGVTSSTFRRIHRNIWRNFGLAAKGERPNNIVNGL